MNMQRAGRETAHTQIYTSNIGSIILEEQHGRCDILGSQPTSMHGAGSSGTKSKKCVVAAACIRVINNILGNKQPCSTLPSSSSHELKSSCFAHTSHSKKTGKKRLQWNTSCCLRTKRIRKADPLRPRGAIQRAQDSVAVRNLPAWNESRSCQWNDAHARKPNYICQAGR